MKETEEDFHRYYHSYHEEDNCQLCKDFECVILAQAKPDDDSAHDS